MMAKRKYQEEMSDEGSLKAVEDKKVENGRRDEQRGIVESCETYQVTTLRI